MNQPASPDKGPQERIPLQAKRSRAGLFPVIACVVLLIVFIFFWPYIYYLPDEALVFLVFFMFVLSLSRVFLIAIALKWQWPTRSYLPHAQTWLLYPSTVFMIFLYVPVAHWSFYYDYGLWYSSPVLARIVPLLATVILAYGTLLVLRGSIKSVQKRCLDAMDASIFEPEVLSRNINRLHSLSLLSKGTPQAYVIESLLLRLSGRFKESLTASARAVEAINAVSKAHWSFRFTVKNSFCQNHVFLSNYCEAARLTQEMARDISEFRNPPPQFQFIVQINECITHAALGKAAKALEAQRAARDTMNRVKGDHSRNRHVLLSYTSLMQRFIGEYNLAVDSAEEYVESTRRDFDAHHPYLAQALLTHAANLLAKPGNSADELQRSAALLKEARDIIVRLGNPNDDRLPIFDLFLADIAFREGRVDEAANLYADSLKGFEEGPFKDTPSHAAVLRGQARIARTCNNTEEAISLFERALTLVEKAFGPDGLVVAETLEEYADALAADERVEASNSIRARATDIRSRIAAQIAEATA